MRPIAEDSLILLLAFGEANALNPSPVLSTHGCSISANRPVPQLDPVPPVGSIATKLNKVPIVYKPNTNQANNRRSPAK